MRAQTAGLLEGSAPPPAETREEVPAMLSWCRTHRTPPTTCRRAARKERRRYPTARPHRSPRPRFRTRSARARGRAQPPGPSERGWRGGPGGRRGRRRATPSHTLRETHLLGGPSSRQHLPRQWESSGARIDDRPEDGDVQVLAGASQGAPAGHGPRVDSRLSTVDSGQVTS